MQASGVEVTREALAKVTLVVVKSHRQRASK